MGDTPPQHALVLQRFLAKESQNPRENQERFEELLEQYPGAADWAKGLLNPDLTPEDLLKEFQSYARPSRGD